MLQTLPQIVGNTYKIKRMYNNGSVCPKGVFRIFNNKSDPFPFHTDGFNYGNRLNAITEINRNLYPIMNANTNSTIAVILVLNQAAHLKNEIDLYNCLVDDIEEFKDEIGMYSHWMGTKYNDNALFPILRNKPVYSPILQKGDLYIFSASRIHKLHNNIDTENRIVLATFACVIENEIILYQ
jgi:hypothetical protein